MTVPLQVAFITGQSDPGSCALSPVQESFLDALSVPDSGRVRRNFPYTTTTRPHRKVPLLAASWHNARQYVASRAPAFSDARRPAVLDLLARADRTVLLAGSCGLEILTNLSLSPAVLRHVHVFAYGPVARRWTACETFAVCGRRDWMARACGGHIDALVDGGHMSYLVNPDVLALCLTFLAEVASRTGTNVS